MGSKEKKAALQEKLEILRTVTNSNAVNQASIIVDATKYIKELKQKVEEDQQELEQDSSLPKVTITTIEKGFLINVLCENSQPGLLVLILEAFEDLGLEVLDVNASCSDTFRLEAVGGESQESVDAQMVRQIVLQAIKKCMETDE